MNETIWCVAHRCAISPEGCVTRQKNAGNGRPGTAAVGHPGVGDFACRDCEQGRLVAAAMREEKRMAEGTRGKRDAAAPPAEEMKVCADPLCEHRGEPQPIGNFARRGRGPRGVMKICRSCWTRRIWEGRRKAREEKQGRPREKGHPRGAAPTGGRPAADAPAAAAPSRPEIGNRSPLERRNLMLIDFSGNDELLEKIKAIAARELRTPEMQVLYWIRQHNLAA
jgi:hypothetical protein